MFVTMKTIGIAVILFCICLVQKTKADDDCPAMMKNTMTFARGLIENGDLEKDCEKYICKKEDDGMPKEEKIKALCKRMKNPDDLQKECMQKMLVKLEETEAGMSEKAQGCMQKIVQEHCN